MPSDVVLRPPHIIVRAFPTTAGVHRAAVLLDGERVPASVEEFFVSAPPGAKEEKRSHKRLERKKVETERRAKRSSTQAMEDSDTAKERESPHKTRRRCAVSV